MPGILAVGWGVFKMKSRFLGEWGLFSRRYVEKAANWSQLSTQVYLQCFSVSASQSDSLLGRLPPLSVPACFRWPNTVVGQAPSVMRGCWTRVCGGSSLSNTPHPSMARMMGVEVPSGYLAAPGDLRAQKEMECKGQREPFHFRPGKRSSL